MLPYAIIATSRIFLKGMRGGRARTVGGYKGHRRDFYLLIWNTTARRALVLLPCNYLAEKILSEKRETFFIFMSIICAFYITYLYLYK